MLCLSEDFREFLHSAGDIDLLWADLSALSAA